MAIWWLGSSKLNSVHDKIQWMAHVVSREELHEKNN